MGYAISIGSGLLVGIGLMIWGLSERKKRHKAERQSDKLERLRLIAVAASEHNAAKALKSAQAAKRVELQLVFVRNKLNEARQRLVEFQDPKTVIGWLDEELQAEEI